MKNRFVRIYFTSVAAVITMLTADVAFSACGGTVEQWINVHGTPNWSHVANWSGTAPNTPAYDAQILAAGIPPTLDITESIGCLEIKSGSLNMTTAATTLTINGDYFRNLNAGSLTVTTGGTIGITMAGTATQTFENYDTVSNLTVSNNGTVSFLYPFTIADGLTLSGTTTTLNINASLTLNFAGTLTIPAGVTVVVGNGATLTTTGGITVNGTLQVNGGGSVVMGNASTLSVGSTGLLNLNGTSGNVATLGASTGNTFTLNVAGSMQSTYFRINRPAASGVNLTGTLISMNNGEFHYITTKCLTLGAAASIPATMNNMSFYNELNSASPKNIDAGLYNGSSTTLNNWAGSIGGVTYDTDPNSKINWGTQAAVTISLANQTASGSPPATIGQNVNSYFATFAFSLSGTATTTNVTSVVLTIDGTATAADVSYVQVFKDSAGGTSCVYDPGIDTQIGSNLSVSGSPAVTSSINLTGQGIALSNATPVCIHVKVLTSSTAVNNDTIGIKIAHTGDVVNDQNYSFSGSSGPPVSGGLSTIVGSPISTWAGGHNPTTTLWTQANNWVEGVVPSTARDCKIGVGTNAPVLTAAQAISCQNATFQNGGSMTFNGANTYTISGSLTLNSGFTFSSATSATISMAGTGNQTISGGTTWPGILSVDNTGISPSNVVSLNSSATVSGNVTVNTGVLKIPNGTTLTVGGNITVASGATLQIDPGGILQFSANGSVLTVNSGGTLSMVGSSGSFAQITSSSTTVGYWVNVNGTIKAQYYSLTNLGVNGANSGLTIQSGATIDTTYQLQNGSFNYAVNNNTQFLRLYKKIPPANGTETLNNMSFNSSGSTATGVKAIYTDATVAAGTVTLNTYSGDQTGAAYTSAGSYAVSWGAQTNTINLTQEATSPASVNQGQTYTMGRFGFQQTQAGAFSNTDITSLKLTLIGTGSTSDITAVRLYFDSGCTGSGGTQIGASGTFSGNPATVTFTIGAGAATIPFAASGTPAKKCIYVQYDISGTAINNDTVGAEVAASSDIVNSQNYAIASGTPTPVTLGTASTVVGTTTTWTGATSTNWFTATNWNGGVPTSALNCTIPSATNAPTINASGAICNTVNITTGAVTMTAGSQLEVYGDFVNTGTFTQSTGTLSIRDNGTTAKTQNIQSGSASVTLTTSNKTAGGTLQFSSSSTIANNPFTLNGSFDMSVPNGATATFSNGLTLTSHTLTINGGGTVQFASGKTLTVNGGNLTVSGTNDTYTQTSTNKGKITNNGGSVTWTFSATSGTISLTGFWLDYLDANGMQITGSTKLSAMDGGQFTNLATNGKGVQINTTGTVPLTSTNVGFEWGAFNASNGGTTCTVGTYYTVYAPNCSSNTITFSQWFGNWWPGFPADCTPANHIWDSANGATCTISMAASASPVTLSSLSATPYNAAVSIDWKTTSELDHMGFNVYRTTDPTIGTIQINGALIRNLNNAGNAQGTYRYVDTNVVNGTSYYYYIQDVAYDGTKNMHGPVTATPQATLANAPATPAGTNGSGSSGNPNNGNAPSNGTIATPGAIDLGNGVHILSQTLSTVRVEIVPPIESYSASTWNAAYEVLSVPGYSHTLTAGAPELVERSIMIEVDPSATSIVVGATSVTEGANSNHNMEPVPTYNLVGGVLVPTYAVDTTVYSTNAYSPSTYFTVDSVVTSIGTKKYLKINATPFRYNPSTKDMKKASRIVLDLGINGGAWQTPNPPVDIARSPALVDGSLRIRYNKSGVYALTYNQMVSANVDGPFAGTSVSNFRMYNYGAEVPIEVRSATGTFSPGDSIRFYAYYSKPLDDNENEIVLSRLNLLGSSNPPLRFTAVNADPTGAAATPESYSWMHATAYGTLNLYENPFGSNWDHFYFDIASTPQGGSPANIVTVPINLPELAPDSTDNVRVYVNVKGLQSLAINPMHHLGLWVNAVSFMVADTQFSSTSPQTLSFQIPARYFFGGTNNITFKTLADQVTAGNYDRVMIESVAVDYKGFRQAVSGYSEIWNGFLNAKLSISNLPSNSTVSIYDVTDSSNVLTLQNVSYVSTDGGVTYVATFLGASGSQYNHGRRFIAVDNSAVMAPTALRLGAGADLALGSSINQADLIIIGTNEMISAAYPLIQRRGSEGLKVITAPLDQVYVEFSNGIRSSQAIRDFMQYALQNWQKPAPRYLLLLGNSTEDPNNFLGTGKNPNNFPIHWETAQYMDFAADNWFVADPTTNIPVMNVGRIPASNGVDLSNYIQKLLAYEDSFSTLSTQVNKFTFVVDKSVMSEGFSAKAQLLASTVSQAGSAFSTQIIDRATIGSDAAMTAAVVNAFSNNSFILSYVGHGAEDRWMNDALGNPIFGVNQASGLINTSYPLVMGLNCLNAKIYDVYNPSLGTAIVMNQSGGAIAFWGPSTMTVPEVQIALTQAFLNELNGITQQAYSVVRLGDLTTRAKIAISAPNSSFDTVRSWEFLGDPTMRIPPSVFKAQSLSMSSQTANKSFFSCGSIGGGGPMSFGETISAVLEMLMIIFGLFLVKKSQLSFARVTPSRTSQQIR